MTTNPDSLRVIAWSPENQVKLVAVDVSAPARILERGHLNGPASSAIQASALTALALMATDLARPEETLTFQMKCDGPVKGFLYEAAKTGGLRGYMEKKVLPDYDESPELDYPALLGRQAVIKVTRAMPGKILSESMITIPGNTPLDYVVDFYYQQSAQRDTMTRCLLRRNKQFQIERATGVMIDRLPECDPEYFRKLQAILLSDVSTEILEADNPIIALAEELDLVDFIIRDINQLKFACHCSSERVIALLRSMPTDDLHALQANKEGTQIFCHMCGRGWTITPDQVTAVLKDRDLS